MEYLPSYTDDLYLEHHGVLGQKWGIRRYQNPDGTLTEAGKKRAYKKDYKNTKKEVRKAIKSGKMKENYSNRDAVSKKIKDEIDNNEAVKNYLKVDNALYKIISDAAAKQGVPINKVVIDGPTATMLNASRATAQAEAKKITNSYIGEYASATLKDIGVKETDAGRDYVSKMLKDRNFEYAYIN